MNIAKFAFFAGVLFFSFIFLFSCSMEDFMRDDESSSSSAAIGEIETCNGIEYSTALFRCDYGELVGKCSGKDYFPATQKCENGQVKEGSSLSSSSAQGNLPATCGGKSYNPDVFRCENGELIGKCRGEDFYYDYEVCNNGVIEPKNTSSSSTGSSDSNASNSSSSSSNSSSSAGKTCNGIGYDPEILQCENGELIGWCKGERYYWLWQVCDNGVIRTKSDCNGMSFSPETQFCSLQDEQVYDRCNGLIYNTALQGCCDKTIYSFGQKQCRNDILLEKCGNNFYDPKAEFCSGNAIYQKCEETTFNVATHGCKDDKITPKCGDDFYDSTKQFCSEQDAKVYDKCNGATYNTSTYGCCNNVKFTLATQGCKEDVIVPKCGNDFYNSSMQFCSEQDNKVYDKCDGGTFNTAIQGCCSNKVYDFAAQSCINGALSSKIVEGSFTDSRDGKIYKTVKIDSQTWMAENLNYSADGSKCYSDDAANCNKYGRLYNYAKANEACPSGWHLPSKAEWTVLADYVGGSSIAGKQLKASEKNEYKFSALMGGIYFNSFTGIESFSYWWTSTLLEGYSTTAYNIVISHNKSSLETSYNLSNRLLSVRCVKN